MSDLALSSEQTSYLLSAKAVRDSAASVFDLTQQNKGLFVYHPENLAATVEFVMKVIGEKYPRGDIPFHSRWGHFRAGGIDRAATLNTQLAAVDAMERARILLDLVITSVLLDAGAGAAWSYKETSSGKAFARSEGLGVASFYMFLAGAMSGDAKSLRADATGLARVTPVVIEEFFQVKESNPLLGVDGRGTLLNGLSKALVNRKYFKDARPGNILDSLVEQYGRQIPATGILSAVLRGFGPIWPGRLSSNGINLGDVWLHSSAGLVAFHKLSQWMTYSLIEPIAEAGLTVTGVEQLTGLAEYRNGGLLIDTGLIQPRDPKVLNQKWRPDSDLVIEWRALTVHLLDIIGAEVQKALGKTPAEFPLAKVLEGGTWWAGRKIANSKRTSGDPPLMIESDGTVF